MQAAQYYMQYDKVVDVSAFMLDIDSRCHSAMGQDDSDDLNEAADEVQLEHENEKRSLSKRTETVLKESTEGSGLKQFEGLVLPSSRSCLQRKTFCVGIASSGEEGEEDPKERQRKARSLVQDESAGERWAGPTRKAWNTSWSKWRQTWRPVAHTSRPGRSRSGPKGCTKSVVWSSSWRVAARRLERVD